MQDFVTAYIGMGSNLGDRKDFIDKAIKILSEIDKVEVTKVSDIIETDPLGGTNELEYLNSVVQINTTLAVEELHKKTALIEDELGRVRQIKWSPRTIDIDLLLYGQEIVNRPNLTVPHSQMHLRSFALKGMCQLAPDLVHPVIKVSMKELADRLNSMDFDIDPESPQLISIAGLIGAGKTTLTKELAKLLNCEMLLEPYDTNPFLPQVYAGKEDLALDSQLYFLASRVEQLNSDTLKKGRIVLTDYIFDKELIYANQLLNAGQLDLYMKIYQPLRSKIVAPRLVIYIRDSAQLCLKRIHLRNRSYEQQISLQFLQDIDSAYEALFHNWKKCPVIRISTEKQYDIGHLTNQIKNYIAV